MSTSSLVRARTSDLPALCDFLLPREQLAVTLSARLFGEDHKTVNHRIDPSIEKVLVITQNGQVSGILAVTVSGILLHALDETGIDRNCREAICQEINTTPTRCIMGQEAGTRLLEECLGHSPSHSADYDLLIRPATPETGRVDVQEPYRMFEIKPATESMHSQLMPLQEGYEREEVLPPGALFDRTAAGRTLMINLKTQYILTAMIGPLTAARAGTNARGRNWDQIGGVYTRPEFRRQGLASELVLRVSRNSSVQGKQTVLFVKEHNTTARNAYDRAGYIPHNRYRISYFG